MPRLGADDELALVLVLVVEVVPRPQVGVLVLVLSGRKEEVFSQSLHQLPSYGAVEKVMLTLRDVQFINWPAGQIQNGPPVGGTY